MKRTEGEKKEKKEKKQNKERKEKKEVGAYHAFLSVRQYGKE